MKKILVVLAIIALSTTQAFAQDCLDRDTQILYPDPGTPPIWCNAPVYAAACQYVCDSVGTECYFGDLQAPASEEYNTAFALWTTEELVPWVTCCIKNLGSLDAATRARLIRIIRTLKK
jgi:hypothetical protein